MGGLSPEGCQGTWCLGSCQGGPSLGRRAAAWGGAYSSGEGPVSCGGVNCFSEACNKC